MRSHFSLLLLVMAGLVVAFAPLPGQPIARQERTVRVEAHQFAYSPSELKVNPGDTVTMLVSTVSFTAYIDGWHLGRRSSQTATITFIADEPGSSAAATCSLMTHS
jgi:plastocyanin